MISSQIITVQIKDKSKMDDCYFDCCTTANGALQSGSGKNVSHVMSPLKVRGIVTNCHEVVSGSVAWPQISLCHLANSYGHWEDNTNRSGTRLARNTSLVITNTGLGLTTSPLQAVKPRSNYEIWRSLFVCVIDKRHIISYQSPGQWRALYKEWVAIWDTGSLSLSSRQTVRQTDSSSERSEGSVLLDRHLPHSQLNIPINKNWKHEADWKIIEGSGNDRQARRL